MRRSDFSPDFSLADYASVALALLRHHAAPRCSATLLSQDQLAKFCSRNWQDKNANA